MNRNVTSEIALTWTLIDSNREVARETCWDDLKEILLRIANLGPTPNEIAILVAPSGETLSIGIAGAGDNDNPGLCESWASIEYNSASQDPPYLVVIGDPTLSYENGGVLVFRFQGDWVEILRRNCVSCETMIQVVHHFFINGSLPDWVLWEQV